MKTIEEIINESSMENRSNWNIYSVGTGKDTDFDISDKDKYVVINIGPDHPEVVFTDDPFDYDDEFSSLSVGKSYKLDSNGNKGIIYRFR